jgi:serralysin
VEGVWSGSGHDTITGDGVRNFLSGGGGNDRVFGGGGADLLSGGSGSDTLAGGAGADEHTGGVGIDYAAYNDADWGNLLISLDNPTLNTGVAAGDTYVSIEGVIGGIGNDTIYGTARTDYLFGGSGNDQLFGGSGNDRLDGGDGADVLYGGAGADQYVGGVGAGVDYARYDDANWGDLLISLINPALNSGAAAGDTYVSIEGIIGGRGSDTIFGDAARNVLQGGSGNDIIDGLDGSDVLVGQVGADRFNFSAALGATNVDTINGFEHGIDKIQLSRAIFKGVGPALDAPEFGTVPGAGKLIVYNQATGELSFDAGGAGAGADAVVFAIVANKVALDIHDFVMIA